MAIKKIEVFSADYSDIEELVQSHYGLDDWSFAEDTESGNDTSHEFKVAKGVQTEWDIQDIQAFRDSEGAKSYMAGRLLNDMCDAGLLEPGEYVIRVCW